MKKIFILSVIFLLSQTTYSQEKLYDILPLENGNVIYTEVLKVKNIDKEELYNKAKKWIVLTYKSANNVIQLDDKEEGVIIGKGYFDINYYSRNPKIEHTIQIETKNERFKYTISNFIYSDKQGSTFAIETFPKRWAGEKKLYRTLDAKTQRIITNLKNSMKTESNNDW